MLSVKELREQIAAEDAKVQAILDVSTGDDREPTEDEQAGIDAIMGVGVKGSDGYRAGTIEKLEEKKARAQKIEDRQKQLILDGKASDQTPSVPGAVAGDAKPKVIIPAACRRRTPKVFTGAGALENAYWSGQWFAGLCGNEFAKKRCEENGLTYSKSDGRDLRPQAALSESSNTAGGYLVPEEFEAAVIDLREQYGVFRANTRVIPMSSDTLVVPRITGDLSTFYLGENTEITASDKTFDQVQLTAKKLCALNRHSTELAEDAAVSIAELLVQDFAWNFALAEDNAGFTGDGTSTFGGIFGAAVKIDDGNHTASVFDTATGNIAFSDLLLTEFESCLGLLPQFASISPAWYISRVGFYASMARLMDAAGGNTIDTIAGGTALQFLGVPVRISQVLNSATGDETSTVKCLVGDLRLASTLGDRRGLTARTTTERYFEFDQIGIQAIQRYDINVHDLGDNTDAGPLVALKTASS